MIEKTPSPYGSVIGKVLVALRLYCTLFDLEFIQIVQEQRLSFAKKAPDSNLAKELGLKLGYLYLFDSQIVRIH